MVSIHIDDTEEPFSAGVPLREVFLAILKLEATGVSMVVA